MNKTIIAFCLGVASVSGFASTHELPLEVHQTLIQDTQEKIAALTLDACSGAFDTPMIDFLVGHKIPATLFVTKRWLDKNSSALEQIKSHPELFEIEDHGARHIPAVIGKNRNVFGIVGNPDIEHLQQEVAGGAEAIEKISGRKPRWYRGATAMYDATAMEAIKKMGYRIAGFSVNADNGATLSKPGIITRLKAVKPGDIIIAHMNKPKSASAGGLTEGLSWLTAKGFRFVKLSQASISD
ncbi:MAG: polysaccharide deacetylase family protein [Burkholderiales bacterium]